MDKLLPYAIDYLKIKMPDFKTSKSGKVEYLTCPFCKTESAHLVPVTYSLFCMGCEIQVGDIYELVRIVELDKMNWTQPEIAEYLVELLKLDHTTQASIEKAFDYYVSQGFDLTPAIRNGKNPFKQGWPDTVTKDKATWLEWLKSGLNIAIKTGESSNVIIVDIDGKVIPEPLAAMLNGYKGFSQKSTRGYHFAYQYDNDIPKGAFDLGGVHIDIESSRGAIAIFPSAIDSITREILTSDPVPVMSKELKELILKQLGPKKIIKDAAPDELPEFTGELKLVGEGGRNNFLVHFGGILRKSLNPEQTRTVLEVVNAKFLKPSLPGMELATIIGSLDKYVKFEERDLATKILDYLRIVGDGDARDIKEVTGETKEKVDKALAFLVREGMIVKARRLFQIIKKANWQINLSATPNRIDFKMPYFGDIAEFNWGDMLLLGSKTKFGKTTMAMNIIQQLVMQGKKPDYISSESGSRFMETAIKLGLREGDFRWASDDPLKVELEKNAITIIDWLMVEDKAQTDKIFKYFTEQLFRTNGLLFIFMQLREDNDQWFAINMAKQYPALSARYLYTDPSGLVGEWNLDAIREAKSHVKTSRIPCKYDWNTKTLSVITSPTGSVI